MAYKDRAYSEAEIDAVQALRAGGAEWITVRDKLVAAGFPDRSADAYKRALYRRTHQIVKTRGPRAGQNTPDGHEHSGEGKARRRIEKLDAKFCEAMARERDRTGINQTAGTETPRPMMPGGEVRQTGWAW